ncbi:4837_t:CDS:2, partial [Entrophospora sp. SA101]
AVATDDECNFFVLGKKIYNVFTSSSEDIEIPQTQNFLQLRKHQKESCTELSPLNRPVTRAKALQKAMDQVNRKGKGPELLCSNDEEEDLDIDH